MARLLWFALAAAIGASVIASMEQGMRVLTSHGVSVFVLRYRLASNGYHYPVMLMDGARAIRVSASGAEVGHRRRSNRGHGVICRRTSGCPLDDSL